MAATKKCEAISKLRDQLELSKIRLAKCAGISRMTLDHIENGGASRVETIVKIIEAIESLTSDEDIIGMCKFEIATIRGLNSKNVFNINKIDETYQMKLDKQINLINRKIRNRILSNNIDKYEFEKIKSELNITISLVKRGLNEKQD